MSHSCAPNCAHSVFPNKTLALQVESCHGGHCDLADGDDDIAGDEVADGKDDDGKDDDDVVDEEDVVKLCYRLK